MIEVEKKFRLIPGDKERLIQGAKPVKKVSLTETYYDTFDFLLTGKDCWLRTREGKWELKIPLSNEGKGTRTSDRYEEVTSEDQIKKELGLRGKSLADSLRKAGFKPFATIVTQREKYEKDGFILDFDQTDFGYSIFEVELLVEREDEMDDAERRILEFALRHGIATTNSPHGKIIEYIFRRRPVHYALLVKNGVV